MRDCDGSQTEEKHSRPDKARQSPLRPRKRGKGASISPSLPYVDELGVVTLLQVVENRSIVEVGQIGHVLGFLILGRVHLLQLILLEVLGLSSGPERERKDRLVVIDHDNRLT